MLTIESLSIISINLTGEAIKYVAPFVGHETNCRTVSCEGCIPSIESHDASPAMIRTLSKHVPNRWRGAIYRRTTTNRYQGVKSIAGMPGNERSAGLTGTAVEKIIQCRATPLVSKIAGAIFE